jgi:hypothetical protein
MDRNCWDAAHHAAPAAPGCPRRGFARLTEEPEVPSVAPQRFPLTDSEFDQNSPVFEHVMTSRSPEDSILTNEMMRAFQFEYVPTLWDHLDNPLLVILKNRAEAPPTTRAPDFKDPGHVTASMGFLMGVLASREPTFVRAVLRQWPAWS